MPGFILHSGATVLCLHGGQASPTALSPHVRVGGQPVTTQSAPYSVAGCPFTPGTNPLPCVTAQFITAATRVRAGGLPVLLQDSQAVCTPNGTGVNTLVTQVRVRGQ
jgi:uncharacterized Zn-binding protein involved in type VI secretion